MRISRDVDGKEIVIVFDSLDRLSPPQALDLFHSNGSTLRALHCHFVFVVPISLFYQPQAPRLPFDDMVIMPMIPILNRNGEPNPTNIDQLRTVLGRRFEADQIVFDPQKSPDDIIQSLILASGGHLRDLVRMLRESCRDALSEPNEKINERIATRSINTLGETLQNAVESTDYDALIQTYRNKAADNTDRTQRLIFGTVILVYDENGVTWKDVHPALARSERFQNLLNAN